MVKTATIKNEGEILEKNQKIILIIVVNQLI